MTTYRHTGASVLFLMLLLLAIGERRLADLHYNLHSLSTLDVGLYHDGIEGDEVALRLIALDDANPPTIAAPASPLARLGAALICAEIAPRPIESPAPRGPPPAPSAPA